MATRSEIPDVPDEPLWFEGMLLAPQHLQQMALRGDRQLAFRMATAGVYGWGIVSLAIDEPALIGGMVRVRECVAVMPDGLIVRYPQSDRRPLEIDITSYAERLRVEPMRIELVVPRGGESDDDGRSERYRHVEGSDEPDLTLAESLEGGAMSRVRVPRRVPNLSLRLADRPTAKSITLPLIEVSLRDEAYARTVYTPPILGLMPFDPLMVEAAQAVRRMREKAVYVAERRRSQQLRAADLDSESLRLPLHALTSGLPELEALIGADATHPFDLFMALTRAAGALTSLSSFTVPRQFRAYRHEDPSGSIAPILAFIASCLDQIRQEHQIVPFEPIDHGYQLDLRTQRPAPTIIVAAQVQPGVTPEKTWDWIEKSLIAAPEVMDRLMARRVLGADRAALDPDEALTYTASPDSVLFQIDIDGENVGGNDILQVINASPAQAEQRPAHLYAFMPAGAAGPAEASDRSEN